MSPLELSMSIRTAIKMLGRKPRIGSKIVIQPVGEAYYTN